MKKFLIAIALALATVACGNSGAPLPTEPSITAESATTLKQPKHVRLPQLSVGVDFVRANALAAEVGCSVYALGASGGAAIFVACEGAEPRQVAQSAICLPYSDGTFAGNCQPSASCVSSGAIGAYGPVYTGSCNVP